MSALGTQTLGRLLVELLLDSDAYKRGLKDAESATTRTSDRLKGIGAALENVVARGFQVAAMAAAAFGAAAAIVGSGFEQQMAQVAAVSGATGAEMEAMTQKARDLGKATMFTATQAGEALQELVQSGMSAAQAMQAVDSVLLLAGTTGATMADSALLVSSTLHQFGLEASQAGRVVDVLAKSIVESQFDFSSLREAMKYAGVAGASFGMTLEETVASVAAFRDLGLEGSLAGTALKMALTQAGVATGPAAERLKKYGLTVADINPETHSFAEILKTVGAAGIDATDAMVIFGARAGASVAVLGKATAEGKLDIEAYTDKLIASGGTAESMYAKLLDTVRSQGLIVKSAFEDLLIETFVSFGSGLKTLFGTVTDTLNLVTQIVKARSGEMRATFDELFTRIGAFVREDGPRLAVMFLDAVSAAMKLAVMLAPLAKHLDVIAALMVSTFMAARIAAFADTLMTVVPAMFAVATGAKSMGAAIAASNPILLALQAVIVATIATLALFEKQTARIEARAAAMATPKTALPQLRQDYAAVNAELAEAQRAMEYLQERASTAYGKGTVSASEVRRAEEEVALLKQRRDLLAQNIHNYEVRADVEAKAAADATRNADEQAAALEKLQAEAARAAESIGGIGEASGKAALEGDKLDDAIDGLLKRLLKVVPMGDMELSLNSKILLARNLQTDMAALMATSEEARKKLAKPFEDLGEALTKLQKEQHLMHLRMEMEEWTEFMEGQFEPRADHARDALAALAEQADQIVPPEELSRTEQLTLLLNDLELAASKSAEAGAALADSIQRVKAERLTAAFQKLKDVLSSIGDVMRQIGGSAAAMLSSLTGGASTALLSVSGAVEATGGATGGASTTLEDEAVAAAQAQADALGQAFDEAAFRESFVPDPEALAEASSESARAYIDELVDGAVAFVTSLADNIGVLISRLTSRLPDLVTAIVAALPRLVDALAAKLPALAMALAQQVPVLIAALLAALPELFSALIAAVPSVIAALVDGMPTIINALIAAVPVIVIALLQAFPLVIQELARAIPVLAVAIIQALVINLLPRIPEIVLQLIVAIVQGAGAIVVGLVKGIVDAFPTFVVELVKAAGEMAIEFVHGIWRFFRDLIKEILSLGTKKTETFGDTPGAIRAGDMGLSAQFAPRDYVAAAQDPIGLLGQAVDLVARLSSSRNAGGAAPVPAPVRPMAPVIAQLTLDGREVARAMISAGRAGVSPEVGRMERAGRAVRVGLDPGRFSQWG